jgi:para-nitrobenzyl esterase
MKRVAPGYAYYFDFMTGKLRDIYPGVPHGWEIPYVFGSVAQANPVDTYYLKGIDICETVQTGAAQMAANVYPTAQFPTTDATSSEDLAFSEQIAAMWTNFARTGNPNGEGDAWPVYDPAQDVMMQFAAESGPVTDLNKARVDPQIEMMKAVFGIE